MMMSSISWRWVAKSMLLALFLGKLQMLWLRNFKTEEFQGFFNFSEHNPSDFNTNSTFRCIDKYCDILITPRDDTEDDLYFLVLVLSAPKNVEKRAHTRGLAWRPDNVPGTRGKVKLVFLLGQVEDKEIQAKLEDEAQEYEDILQINVEDSYRNLPYKSVAGFLWATDNYSPRYIVKADDDLWLNTEPVVDALEDQYPDNTQPDPHTIHCSNMIHNMAPFRNFRHKLYLSENEFKADRFPPYCIGWFYVLTAEMARNISIASSTTKFMFIDDAFITGIVRLRVPGSRLTYLRKGSFWRSFWSTMTMCNYFGIFELGFVNNIAKPLDYFPVQEQICVVVERYFSIILCDSVTKSD